MKNTHDLKSWPESFRAVLTGRKRFEVRRDDRQPPISPGDTVILHEWDPARHVAPAGGVSGLLLYCLCTADWQWGQSPEGVVICLACQKPRAPGDGYTGKRAAFLVGFVQRGAPMPPGWCAFDLISSEDAQRVSLAFGMVAP